MNPGIQQYRYKCHACQIQYFAPNNYNQDWARCEGDSTLPGDLRSKHFISKEDTPQKLLTAMIRDTPYTLSKDALDRKEQIVENLYYQTGLLRLSLFDAFRGVRRHSLDSPTGSLSRNEGIFWFDGSLLGGELLLDARINSS